uniref:Uncharacterized protein n=1 Tax=Arion vulgaris TaxID=1028688 RepID=A0A0B6YRI0_9EUPU
MVFHILRTRKIPQTHQALEMKVTTDEKQTDLGTSCPKKRKLDESSKTKSNPSLGGKEDSDSPMSGDCKPQAGSIIKCKDFSFESTTELVQQQKQCLFTQENSVHISHSFFRLVYEAGRSGCMIDREDIVSKYTTEPVETIVANTDREVLRSAKEKVQSKEFVWAHFSDYSEEMELATQERKEKLMRKVDKRVHRVMKHVKPNSLVLLVMTGRDSDDLPQNIATFITTT